MDKDLRKRLGEAAENFLLPYEKLYHPAIHLGFLAGAELGYKEAIKTAKEWLKKQLIDCDYTYLDDAFETDMNKLWEE